MCSPGPGLSVPCQDHEVLDGLRRQAVGSSDPRHLLTSQSPTLEALAAMLAFVLASHAAGCQLLQLTKAICCFDLQAALTAL
jgi:hypothetical protein